MNDLSEDEFLDGKLTLRQPRGGFRAGLDSVLLAAAVPATFGQELLELGSGVGTVSLCCARRAEGARFAGIEIDEKLVDVATRNAAVNGLADRVVFAAGDALALPAAFRREFDHVFCNPPFYSPEGEVSPDAGRARAKMDGGKLTDWLVAGLKRTRSGGSFTAIFRTDRLAEALAVLPGAGVTVFPLWPKPDNPAKRVILQVRNGARTPLALLSGLVLHQPDGRYTPEADAILRGEAALSALVPAGPHK
jgi:tRNA1Val (adenine37-N6)-methyltransferase